MRAWLEINLDNLGENFAIIKKTVGSNVGVIAVVKSDAYGHGIEKVAGELDKNQVDMFAVISLEEARRVRRVSSRSVLVMGFLTDGEISEAIEEGFVLSLYDRSLIKDYERIASRLNKRSRVHLKIETGLHRLGVSPEDAVDILLSRRHFPHVAIESLFSHLVSANNYEQNVKQLRVLQELILKIQDKMELLPIHLVSSGGLAIFPEGYFDAVRVGLALYGVEPVLAGIKPTLSCKAIVNQVKRLEKGDGVSYDHLFIAPKPMTVAIVAIGYGEGYSQALTGLAKMIVKNKICPSVGKICMNHTVVDVTGLDVKRGDEVTVIGQQVTSDGQEISVTVAELAKMAQLRHHEIITRLGAVLPKKYIGG